MNGHFLSTYSPSIASAGVLKPIRMVMSINNNEKHNRSQQKRPFSNLDLALNHLCIDLKELCLVINQKMVKLDFKKAFLIIFVELIAVLSCTQATYQDQSSCSI